MMQRHAWLTLLVVVSISGCAAPSAEQQVIGDATAALGGRDRIEAVKTLVVTGEGTGYSVGSDRLIDTTYRVYEVTGYKHAIDRHVPLHGFIVPHSEFLQVVKDGYDRRVVKEPPSHRYSPS